LVALIVKLRELLFLTESPECGRKLNAWRVKYAKNIALAHTALVRGLEL